MLLFFLQQTHQQSPPLVPTRSPDSGANPNETEANDSVMEEAIRLTRARMRKTNHINNSSEAVS